MNKRAEEEAKQERRKQKQDKEIYKQVFGDKFKKVVDDKPEIELKNRPVKW